MILNTNVFFKDKKCRRNGIKDLQRVGENLAPKKQFKLQRRHETWLVLTETAYNSTSAGDYNYTGATSNGKMKHLAISMHSHTRFRIRKILKYARVFIHV